MKKINLEMLKLNQMLITDYYMNLYEDSRDEYIKDMIAIHCNLILKQDLENIRNPKTEIDSLKVQSFRELVAFIKSTKKQKGVYFYDISTTVEKVFDKVAKNSSKAI